MPDIRIDIDHDPKPEDNKAVTAGLGEFNRRHAPQDEPRQLSLFVRDEHGKIIGGLLADMQATWLHVRTLWLDESLRGRGLGSKLLALAAEEGRAGGCKHAWLDTFSWQARPFYEKHGWRVVGQIDDLPPGATRYYLRKELA
jgi:GNAT superfamily N-acetyltransferase